MTQSDRLKEKFLNHIEGLAQGWASPPDLTPIERTRGVAYSILASLDGTSPGVPMMDLVPVTEENEFAEMWDLVCENGEVVPKNIEKLQHDTKIEAGNLCHDFINLRKEAAAEIAENEEEK